MPWLPTLCLLCSIATISAADVSRIRYVFESMLNGSTDALPKMEDLVSLLDGAGELTTSEVELLLPLAKRCLYASGPEVRQAGMLLMFAAVTRLDSAKLLEPYLDDLAAIVNSPGNPLRHGALYIVGSAKPNLPPKAIATLAAHLDDKSNSFQEVTTIVVSLLEACSSDNAMVHRILEFAEKHPNVGVKNGVLRQLGLTKTRNEEAVSYIARGLDSDDIYVRASAIDATDRVDADLRQRFVGQLRRIASDRNESEENRSHAESVLRR